MDARMLRSFLLAGLFLITSNFLPAFPAGVPIARTAQAAPAPRVAVKHSEELLATGKSGVALRYIAPAGVADELRPEEREFIARINGERVSRGLNALTPDPLLVEVAREHSREMCDLDYFDHHSPTAGITTPMDRYLKGLQGHGLTTPGYLLVGENIYYCSVFDSQYNVGYGHQALMNSPGHRANILEPRFARVGIGVYEDPRGQIWVTQMFLKDTSPDPQ